MKGKEPDTIQTTVSLNTACEIVKKFMSQYMRNTIGYMLTGSYATEQANATSDIDVVVINQYTRLIFVESFCYEGYKIQIIALPLLDIDYIIYKDAVIRKGVYLHQLATGIILNDKDNILKKLKQKCLSIYNRGPHKLSENEICHLRGKITTRIEDLKGCSNPDELYYIAIELYQFLIDAYFKINQKWIFTGKSAGRILKKEAYDFHELLKSAYIDVSRNDKSKLIRLAEYVLRPIGGTLYFTSTSVCSSLVIGDYLTIFVPTSHSQVNMHLVSALCTQFLHTMNKLAPKYNWIKINWLYGQSNQPGIFLICHSPNKRLNEELLPMIDIFVKSLDKTTLSLQANLMEYPYLYSPLDGIRSDKSKFLLYNLIKLLQKYGDIKVFYRIVFNLIKYIWNRMKNELKDNFLSTWVHLEEMFYQRENKLIIAKETELYQDLESVQYGSIELPDNLEECLQELMNECINFHKFSLLSTPYAQIQYLHKILQLINSIHIDIDIYIILKKIRLNHD